MRFSVIVPVYNVEKYLKKCLDSILGQTYKDFEVLVVNDGSPDNSQTIIDEYSAKYPTVVKGFIKENGGLSDARNYGVERANGDYIVFVDSDDYIADGLLENLYKEICLNSPDVIGYNCLNVDSKGQVYGRMTKPTVSAIEGQSAIKELVLWKQCFDPAWSYAYKKEYWDKNGFEYMKGIYHEDFALTPIVIFKAGCVSFLDYFGYYYLCNEQGITKNIFPEKQRRLAFDLLKGYDYLVAELGKIENCGKYESRMYLTYIASALIYRLESLEDGTLKTDFRTELKKRKIIKNIMDDTFKRKIRKLLLRMKNRL